MTENQYIDALVALGCTDATSVVQKENGTTAFRLPDGVNMITEHRTGYIRRSVLSETKRIKSCYQLNPTYKVPFKSIGWSGELLEWETKARAKIWSRKERLKRLLLYTIKQVNDGKS